MKNRFLEKATAHIKPEERALMVKSLEIISQIHEILDRKNIAQKALADALGVSSPAVSKMLCPGGNLELNTIIKLEIILGDIIVTTPKSERDKELISRKEEKLPRYSFEGINYKKIAYTRGESGLYVNKPLTVMGAN